MKSAFHCWFLGHDLEAIPPQFEERESGYNFIGQKGGLYRVKISNGEIRCKHSGCEFNEWLLDENNPRREMEYAKFRNTFWSTNFWRKVVDWVQTLVPIAVWIFFILSMLLLIFAVPSIQACTTLHTKFGLETVWDFWNGCMIHSEKFGWIPQEQFFQIINLNIP